MYNGWTVSNEVALVIKNNKSSWYGYEYPQAYVVDPKNKQMMKRACEWGKTSEQDEKTKEWKKVEPEVRITSNDGFKFSLLDNAHSSSQGGKLSFWNCLFEKDDIKVVIGVNAALLLSFLKQSDLHNGVCKQTVSFARNYGDVGILHKGMEEYKRALEDSKAREKAKTGKTKKWEVGYHYKTLTLDEICLGKYRKPIKSADYCYIGLYNFPDELKTLLGKEKYSELVRAMNKYNGWSGGSCEEYILEVDKDNIETLAIGIGKCESLSDGFNDYSYRVNSYVNTPARNKGDRASETDTEIREETLKFVKDLKTKCLNGSCYRDDLVLSSVTDADKLNKKYINDLMTLFKKSIGDPNRTNRSGDKPKDIYVIINKDVKKAFIDLDEAEKYIRSLLEEATN